MAARAEAQPYRADWKRGGITSWITTVDHKRIGILYIGTSLFFLLLGGLLSMFMRAQLATPNEHFVTRARYNELFTIHGTTMIFLVVVPILAGFGNYLVPLMIGARDVAFPRLNALSYWLFLLGGIVLYSSFFAKGGPSQAGWTGYTTLTELKYSPGHGVDLWIVSLHILALSSLAGAINFITTIHNMRTPGMTWTRMPLFIWSIVVYAWLLVVILPVIGAGLLMLLLDRQVGTHFFIPDQGGSALLYQHIFWFFGHPEVYVIILPAMGMVSEIIPVFARKPIFGYKAVAFSTVGIAFVSMLVWAHHMFTVGLGWGLQSFFMITTMLVAIPTGVKILNWLATTWRGNLIFDTPMLFALGFIAIFTIGGLTGIYLAAFPVDWQVQDTYFVVAHFHYTLFGGAVFAIFGGLFYWWPKMFGRKLNETLGKWSFLADVRRVQRHVLPSALPRAARDAATHLHLLERRVVGGLEPHLDDRFRRDGGRSAALLRQRLPNAAPRCTRRQRSVDRRHARVVRPFAAPAGELPAAGPVRQQPPPAPGSDG